MIFVESVAEFCIAASGGTKEADEDGGDGGFKFGFALRLNANLDFGAVDVRRPSNVFSNVFNCYNSAVRPKIT